MQAVIVVSVPLGALQPVKADLLGVSVLAEHGKSSSGSG